MQRREGWHYDWQRAEEDIYLASFRICNLLTEIKVVISKNNELELKEEENSDW